MKDLNKILDLIKPLVIKTELDVNTNNAWGFGGAVKDIYHLKNGLSIHQGKAYYRHASPKEFINIRDTNIICEGVNNIIHFLKVNGIIE